MTTIPRSMREYFMAKTTPFGEIEILDAHTHFFSRRFFETLTMQSPGLSNEAAPIELLTVFRRALTVAGPERLLFGTDSSFFPRGWNETIFQAQVNTLVEIGASEQQAAAILGGNLRRLLKLDETVNH